MQGTTKFMSQVVIQRIFRETKPTVQQQDKSVAYLFKIMGGAGELLLSTACWKTDKIDSGKDNATIIFFIWNHGILSP